MTSGGILKNIYWQFRGLFSRKEFLLFELSPSDLDKTTGSSEYAFRQLTRDEFSKVPVPNENHSEEFLWHCNPHTVAYGFVNAASSPVATFWYTQCDDGPKVPFEMGLSLNIAAGFAYVWDCRTATGSRRQGLYTAGLRKLRAISTVPFLIYCESKNLASQTGILKAGGRQIGVLKGFHFGLFTIISVNKTPRFYWTRSSLELSEIVTALSFDGTTTSAPR